jgi:neopullulanase
MRVVLDGVFNHTGRGFWPFHHVLETGGGSPYRNWFHFDQVGLDRHKPIDAYPIGRLRAGWPQDEPWPGSDNADAGTAKDRLGYEAWWGIPALPKLNVAEPGVREYLWGVAEHWLRFGIDGWRLDVPAEIDDREFWAEFRRRCRAVNPEAYLVGEIWGVAPDWVSGDRFDALMNYPLAEAILGFAAGRSLNEQLVRSHHEYAKIRRLDGAQFGARLAELLGAYPPETIAVQLNLLGSHDTPRALSLLGGDREALQLAVLLQATLPGAPCTYYGDEVGLVGGLDPDNRRAFPWDQALWDVELLQSVRAAFALRRAEPALRADGVTVIAAEAAGLAFARRDGDRLLAIALNAGEEPLLLSLDAGGDHSSPNPDTLLAVGRTASSAPTLTSQDGRLSIEMPPRSGAVVRLG